MTTNIQIHYYYMALQKKFIIITFEEKLMIILNKFCSPLDVYFIAFTNKHIPLK